ncbi:iron ABC transporter permease [Gracilibacillus sp. YIM 98692]|uniref:FecCD family ABC transporter permease n=1 Tax=Gracilibacillus sp. YIM 98692 TaxID=2663532 RepID=UPI0013D34503|nr:iron ABC transporter permease [Gracilibacillus sp. YIM 98692]
MKKLQKEKSIMLLLCTIVVLVTIIGIGVGAVFIHPKDILLSLAGVDIGPNGFIIQQYRLPRIIIALLAGSSLAISGAILQGIIRNPLASPDVIGITKGAGLAAAIVIILFPHAFILARPIAAFVGASIVAILLYLFAYKTGLRPTTLALVGIALGAICHAGIQFLLVKFPVDVNAALIWLTGSLWGKGWEDVWLLLPLVLILIPLTVALALKLDILNLGDDVAEGLGEPVGITRMVLLFLAVALAGSSVAIVGSLGFIGLIAPHMARQLVGNKHRLLLPTSALVGMLIVLVADGLGRGVMPPVEIPAGIFTAVIGAPYFLFLLKRLQTKS